MLLLLLPLAGLGAQEVQIDPIKFIHESYDTPELMQLRESFEFDEAVASGKDEFERMAILKDWSFRSISFYHNYRQGNLRNALTILAMTDSGSSFHCSHLAAVFMQCALSMGWTSRYLFVRNTLGEEHASNEIWSNQYNKWVMVDVTWNVHFEKQGIPLSSLEIRREWVKNGGKDVTYVFGAGDNEKQYTNKDFPVERGDNNAWVWWPLDENFIAYVYEIALVSRNNFFSHAAGDGSAIWDSIVILKDEINSGDMGWAFRNRPAVEDMKALYHDLNRVDVQYRPINRETLSVELSAQGPYNYTPNFEEFLIRLNGSSWQSAGAAFTWKLSKGENVLEARIKNRFGVLGPPTTIRIFQPR
jgi:hypothetical protein